MENRKTHISTLLFFLGILFLLPSCQTKNEKPNILLILTDDQGYGDLSMIGNPYLETPNLDQLAKEGAHFTNFYVSPVCAPTRASLLTGRYHQRTGVSGVTRGRENMNLNEKTIADYLKAEGYQTACFGKWHNGAHYPYHPNGRGFDEFYGFTAGHLSNYYQPVLEHNGEEVIPEGYITDILSDKAIDFIRKSEDANEPFFCYLAYNTPHTPVQVDDKYYDKYKAMGLSDFDAGIYGMMENIDDNVAKVLNEIEELNIKNHTIVIFLSDNGPLNFRYNAGLKGRKGSVDEGGMRVPCFIRWPNHIQVQTQITQASAHIDLLPTLLEMINSQTPPKNKMDGMSLLPQIMKKAENKDRLLFQEWSGKRSVRSLDYLMVDQELFHLQSDSCQKTNIALLQPELMKEYQSKWQQWYQKVKVENAEPKAIPVGHQEFPKSILPAHESILFPPFEFRKDRKHTGIAYHAKYGWAHDWIDFWTSTDAYAEWNIDILEEGNYQITLSYNCDAENIGTVLTISAGQAQLVTEIDEAFVSEKHASFDRIKRSQEAPTKSWAKHQAGILHLKKGETTLQVKTQKLVGQQSIELKDIQLTQIEQ